MSKVGKVPNYYESADCARTVTLFRCSSAVQQLCVTTLNTRIFPVMNYIIVQMQQRSSTNGTSTKGSLSDRIT